MMNRLLNSAFEYQKAGLSVIPVNKDKKPLISWITHQKERADAEQIRQWWSKWPDANVGIVTGAISNIAVIDIDTEEGKQAIQKYVPDSLVIPVVNTPRGGQHLYFKYPDEKLRNNAGTVTGCDLRANGGYVVAPPSSNGNGKAYTWQEGLKITQVPVPELPEAYLSFVKKNAVYNKDSLSFKSRDDTLGTTDCRHESSLSSNIVNYFSQGQRDETLFHLANALVKGKCNKAILHNSLEIIANNCTPPFQGKELSAKINSALKRASSRTNNLTQEVRDFILSSSGVIVSPEVASCLHLSSREERKNLSKILSRFCNEGLLEKYGNRNGHFRIVNDEAREIDFLNADVNEIKIDLPFQLNSLVNIYPKNIIVIAGSSDAGKTAFLLNVAEMNMDKHDIYYFSSEMVEQELKLRLSKFDRPLKDFKHVKWLERSSDFSDVIKPDAINIVDFLEMHEDFWIVGKLIKQIFGKLNKGIAIIALQKDRNKEYGLGATRSAEKARLYLTMNPNELTIVKAKNWHDPLINPHGMKLKFDLFEGYKFSTLKQWHKDKEN